MICGKTSESGDVLGRCKTWRMHVGGEGTLLWDVDGKAYSRVDAKPKPLLEKNSKG